MNKIDQTVAIILQREDKVYLSKRVGTETFPDYWQVPGGKVEEGESTLDAAKRELKEETGFNLLSHRFVYEDVIEGDPTCYQCHVFSVMLREDEEPETIETEKQTPWEIVSLKKATQLDNLMPGLKNIFEWLLSGWEEEPSNGN